MGCPGHDQFRDVMLVSQVGMEDAWGSDHSAARSWQSQRALQQCQAAAPQSILKHPPHPSAPAPQITLQLGLDSVNTLSREVKKLHRKNTSLSKTLKEVKREPFVCSQCLRALLTRAEADSASQGTAALTAIEEAPTMAAGSLPVNGQHLSRLWEGVPAAAPPPPPPLHSSQPTEAATAANRAAGMWDAAAQRGWSDAATAGMLQNAAGQESASRSEQVAHGRGGPATGQDAGSLDEQVARGRGALEAATGPATTRPGGASRFPRMDVAPSVL
eukprot:361293-Chlamydomonas_euryale.AAC.3